MFAFDQKDASYPPQTDYMVLEHSNSELEKWVTADKMAGRGCMQQNKCIKTLKMEKGVYSTKIQSGQKHGKVSHFYIYHTQNAKQTNILE